MLFVVRCIFNFVVMGYNIITPVFLIERFGAQPMSIAGLLAAVGVANVLVQAGLVGRLVATRDEQRIAVVSLLFQGLGLLAVIAVPGMWLLHPLSIITSGGAGPFRPTMSALLSHRVGADKQGKLNGVSTALGSLMTVFGPLAAGAMYDMLVPSAPFWTGAGLLVLVSIMLQRIGRNT